MPRRPASPNRPYPRAITFTRCSVIDRQAVPTTNVAFRSNVAPIAYPAEDYDKPNSIRAIECKVDVPGLSRVRHFLGVRQS